MLKYKHERLNYILYENKKDFYLIKAYELLNFLQNSFNYLYGEDSFFKMITSDSSSKSYFL